MTNSVAASASWLAAWARPRNTLEIGFIDGVWGALAKAWLPLVAFIIVAPLLWLFFRETWRELDFEATTERLERHLSNRPDYRPWAMFAIVGLVLTTQEYYGGSRFYGAYVRPWLMDMQAAQATSPGGLGQYVDTVFYGELYSYAWWAFTRIGGYTLVPFAAWKLLYRRDSLLDMGLRSKDMMKHAWIYVACLVVILPTVYVVSLSPEFSNYYPFYKDCSRSWYDLIVWESMYIAQFFALEMFFRGFMLSPLRGSLGTGAIFAMCVPYVMIHYGKPYLEASSAFLAGIALGSLAMRTRSIYWGFGVHVSVALLMDGLAIAAGGGFPTTFWPR